MKMKANQRWLPPGKNCGLCGEENCRSFLKALGSKKKEYADCPFYKELPDVSIPCVSDIRGRAGFVGAASHQDQDVLGHPYDFILSPLPGEISARKIVLPFRSDLVEKMDIKKGDLVLGRPMGAGCPVPHVLEIIRAEPVTGLLYTWVVGPKYSREKEVKDVAAYHMIGFEGLAVKIARQPSFGCRVSFLPGFCMMNLNHTGVVNMLLGKKEGLHVRIEDIRIMANV